MKILKAMAALFCFTLLGAAFSLPVVANDWSQAQGQPTEDRPAMDSSAQSTVTTNEAAQSEPSATSQQPGYTNERATSESQQEPETAKELPKTASPLPLIALAGFLAASSGLGLRILAKKRT